jgi:hypothetical protein
MAYILLPLQACSKPINPYFVPYVPPSYYDCTETTIPTLMNAYWDQYSSFSNAEIVLYGKVFVFKNIAIEALRLQNATDTYIWINAIQFNFLTYGNQTKLHAGELVDIVGVNAGIGKEYPCTLVFTGCMFLHPGSVQLPAVDSGIKLSVY